MQYLSSLLILVSTITSLTSASAIPSPPSQTLSKRLIVTPDDLYQDITNIHNGVLANQQASLAYQGGNPVTTLMQGGPVLASVGQIHIVNRKGFADANLSGPIDEADTQRIVQHTVDTVGNSIPTAVDILVNKKDVFVSSGQRETVIGSFKLLLNDHDTFSAALLSKTYMGNPALNAQANGVVAKIHNAIQGGIDAYSS